MVEVQIIVDTFSEVVDDVWIGETLWKRMLNCHDFTAAKVESAIDIGHTSRVGQ